MTLEGYRCESYLQNQYSAYNVKYRIQQGLFLHQFYPVSRLGGIGIAAQLYLLCES